MQQKNVQKPTNQGMLDEMNDFNTHASALAKDVIHTCSLIPSFSDATLSPDSFQKHQIPDEIKATREA